jgi:hypothetical protein
VRGWVTALKPRTSNLEPVCPTYFVRCAGGLSCLRVLYRGATLWRLSHTAATSARSTARRRITGQIGLSPRRSGPTPRPQFEVSRHRTSRPPPGRGNGRTHSSGRNFDSHSPGCLEGTETRDRPGRRFGIEIGGNDRWPDLRVARPTAPGRESGEGVKRLPEAADVQHQEISRGICCDR